MDIVNAVLENDQKENQYKSTKVDKEIEVEIDEGTLCVTDSNAFNVKTLRNNQDKFVKNLTRDNVQLLINAIWELPTERIEEAIVAKLPKPKYLLPRSRVVPKPKPLTKWQQFAKEKGIRSKKKGKAKLKWDDELKKWIPTYGFKRSEEQKQWVMEVKDNQPDTEDTFGNASKAKKEKQAKNELQRLRNIARSKNIKLPTVGLPSAEQFRDSKQLSTAVTVARVSTASVGKFQEKFSKEKDAKGLASQVPGLKRKRKAPPANVAEEKKRNVSFADDVLHKKPILKENATIPTTTPRKKASKKGGKKSARPTSQGTKKPKGGKGKRDLHTKVGGRKRR